MYLQDHPNILANAHKVQKLLDLLCEKMVKRKEMNEVMAIKFHYQATIVKHCSEYHKKSSEDGLNTWIKRYFTPSLIHIIQNKRTVVKFDPLWNLVWNNCDDLDLSILITQWSPSEQNHPHDHCVIKICWRSLQSFHSRFQRDWNLTTFYMNLGTMNNTLCDPIWQIET